MAFRFTEEDFERYVTKGEHGGRHIWDDLREQLKEEFGVPFGVTPYERRGDWLVALWFYPKNTPRSSWSHQAQFWLRRDITKAQLDFGLLVECSTSEQVDQLGADSDRDGERLVTRLESDQQFRNLLDRLVQEQGFDLGNAGNAAELLATLKEKHDEEYWAVGVKQSLTKEEAVALGEEVADRIMDAFRATRPLFEAVIPDAVRHYIQTGERLPSPKTIKESPQPEATVQGVDVIRDYLAAQGLSFTPHQIATFATALQTKGFVVLSGISGTGKTKLAQHFAELLRAEGDDNHLFVPVRPDWRDSKSLLGYYNPLTQTYEWTDFLRFLISSAGPSDDDSLTNLSAWLQETMGQPQQQQWTRQFQSVRERLVGRPVKDYEPVELDLIWNEKSNGVANIGQAISHPFDLTDEQLRQATAIAADDSLSPGQRLIEVVGYLHNLTGVHHWVRSLRALALFDPEHVTTVADYRAIRDVLERLGYPRRFDLPRFYRQGDDRAIDRAFDFLIKRLRELLPTADLLTRACAAWHIKDYKDPQPADAEPVTSPRFVILDEMNLARVEYYFADFLSVLESGRWTEWDTQHGKCEAEQIGFTKEPLRLHYPPQAEGPLPPQELFLPPNLYVVGTVNVDETTHAFSPKVLDRAFTIEFTEVNLAGYPPSPGTAPALSDDARQALAQAFTRQGCFAIVDKGRVADFVKENPVYRDHLAALNEQLQPHDLQFAYRVFDEIVTFLDNVDAAPWGDGFAGLNDAFDTAVLMKVLPKFHGSRGRLLAPLRAVLAWAQQPGEPDLNWAGEKTETAEACLNLRQELDEQIAGGGSDEPAAFVYPRTARKVVRMLSRLHDTGFASFG